MRKGFRSLPARITAAILTAGLIVSSSNLDYVRFVLPGVQSVSQVEASYNLDENVIPDPDLLKAMKIIVNYSKESDVSNLNGNPLNPEFAEYADDDVTMEQVRNYSGNVDLSNCSYIDDLTGLGKFEKIKSADISCYTGESLPADLFKDCTLLSKVTISDKVKTIGASAFQKCTNLSEIDVKGDDTNNAEGRLNLINIKRIESSAFNSAQEFFGITFDEDATELYLGNNAFSQCTSLRSVDIPTKDYGNLGQGVFSDCVLLSKVTLNDNLKRIPALFFKGSNLSQMDKFPSKLEEIGIDAFARTRILTPDLSGCESLKLIDQGAFQVCRFTANTTREVKLPDSLEGDAIKRIAFLCSNVKTINIPDKITTIAAETFEGCTELTTVKTTVNSELTTIGPWAFRRCDSLPNTDFIKDLKKLKTIGEYAFSECYSIKYVEKKDANGDVVKDEKGYTVYEPDKDDWSVYTIETGINDITLPESLTTLGAYAFANDYAAATINTGDNLIQIPDYAFAIRAETAHTKSDIAMLQRVNNAELNDPENLSYIVPKRTVTLSNKLESIGEGAFKYNTGLNTVTYNDYKEINKEEIQESTLVLPSTVISIGDDAFSYCTRWSEKDGEDGKKERLIYGLSKVDIRNLKLESFGKGVFEYDFFMNEAILPIDLETIPENLFLGCGKEIRTIETVEENGINKQYNRISAIYGLESVVFPMNVKEISKAAFMNCIKFEYKGRVFKETTKDNKTTYSISDNIYKEYDRVAKAEIDLYKLPDTLEVIGDNAFNGCWKLGKIALNANIKSIGESAFKDCSLLNLNPPANAKENVNYETGYGLTYVSFKLASDLKEIKADAFNNTEITEANMTNNTKLKIIPAGVFGNCYYLIYAELPWSVTEVGSKVYGRDVRIKEVMLPTISKIPTDLFYGVDIARLDSEDVKVSLNTRDRIVKVPIGQTDELNFITSPKYEYHYEQFIGTDKLSESEEFVKVDTANGKVLLTGKREVTANSTLRIENVISFRTTSLSDGREYDAKKVLGEEFELTVTDVWAKGLKINAVKQGGSIAGEGDDRVLTISADLITDSDATSNLEVSACADPTPRSKNVIWGTSDSNVITVSSPVAEDDLKEELKKDNVIGKVHVKGVGEAKLWVSNGAEGEAEVKDEIKVKVVYPITSVETTVGTLEADTNSFQLEEGAEDTITVKPTYSDDGSKAGADSQAKIYYESSDPTVATIDSETGKVVAQNKTGNTIISMYDDTGKLLKQITLNVVEEGKLVPNLIKITPEDRVNVYNNKDSEKIVAKVFPEKASQEVEWTIDNTEIASVKTNEDGSATVTGKLLGETCLNAISKNNRNVTSRVLVSVAEPATALKFQKPSFQLAVDGTIQIPMTNEESENLSLMYQPVEASKDTVTWKISDETVAQFVDSKANVTLANGVPIIKGLKQGTTKLTVTTGNNLSSTIDIEVYKPLTEFSVPEKKSVHKGETFKLDIKKTPADSIEKFTFVSSNPDIATVDAAGNVKGITEGQVYISAVRSNNESKACLVTVVGKVDQISILDAPIEIGVEGTYVIGRASGDPETKNGYRLSPNSIDEPTWSSSNSAVATVEAANGGVTIKGVAPGSATITATTLSGQSASINITVVSLIKELKFTEESKKIAVGTQAAVTLNKTPADSLETIKFTSSNEEIATVDQNGIVTGIAKGDVSIYATSKVSNVSTAIPVTITVPATKVQAITHFASEKKIYLVKGNTYQLRYKILPEESTDKVTFTSNKKKIAPISEDGTITAKKKGNATITIKTESGKTAKVKVYVVNKEKNAKKIKIKTASIKVGKTVKLKYTVTSATTTNSVGYSVDKPEIASIDEFGYITGLKKGKVKVTITMSNGKAKTKTIKVKK